MAMLVVDSYRPASLRKEKVYEGRDEAEKKIAKEEARGLTTRQWQEYWEIEMIADWMNQHRGEVNFHLTQFFTSILVQDADAGQPCILVRDDTVHTCFRM